MYLATSTLGRDSSYNNSGTFGLDFKEIIGNIKTIKIFAWEPMFLDPKYQQVNPADSLPQWASMLVYIIQFALRLAKSIADELGAYLTIHMYVLSNSGHASTITNAKLFELGSLMDNLQTSMASLTFYMASIRSALVDSQYVEDCFENQYVYSLPYSDDTTKCGPLVELSHCSFDWGYDDYGYHTPECTLTDVSLNAGAGELVAIVGRTGAGKSSLLLAMCSEMEMTGGTGRLVGKIAYLEQQPWIMNDTLRANILFGREYDEKYYWEVLHACALTDDLEMWPNSDMTVIGENGFNISGGQRARLALARTVYSRADIYFLDDPLSAVDAIVKRHILDNIILSTGILGNKLRFVTTNADNILPLCNQVVTVDNGHVSVRAQTPLVHKTIGTASAQKTKPKSVDSMDETLQPALPTDETQVKRIPANNSAHPAGTNANASASARTQVSKRRSHWDNAKYAIRTCGWSVITTTLLTSIFSRVLQYIFTEFKLDALRANSKSDITGGNTVLLYMRMKMLSNISYSLLSQLQLAAKGAVINWSLKKRVNNMLVRSLLFSPLSFFEGTTAQQVYSNSFTANNTIVHLVPRLFTYDCSQAALVLLLAYRVLLLAPQLLIFIPVLVWTSRVASTRISQTTDAIAELKRSSESMYQRVQSLANNGAQMIRLFGVEPFFTSQYIKCTEDETRLEALKSSSEDYSYILQKLIGQAIKSVMSLLYIAKAKFSGVELRSNDLAGFQESTSLLIKHVNLTVKFPGVVLKALDKVNEFRDFAERDPEAPYVVDSCRPSAQWPPNGKIEFRNFSMKYGADQGYALKNINLAINSGEKIGIVGRTGAGKSSLAKVLFRLIHEHTSGSILIDGQDISEFGVGDYRPRLGMIPQESSMFGGSIRRNLDPLNQFDIEEMWGSMTKCNMAKFVSSNRSSKVNRNIGYDIDSGEALKRRQWQKASWLKRVLLFILKRVPRPVSPAKLVPHGLDKPVKECFGGFSSGQQQLFGLCRVIMRKRKIIVLDEATANVDLEADKSVQELIRKEFKDCTVLTIAHRLETIMKSDRIIVMDKGTIAEIGTPQELLAKDGMFAQLVKTSDFGQ
ncbi:ABC transporter C member 13 [Coemansia sp. IMI 209128]|nr:ABC transporter C member 13 [Coemansia sp. IMI 209128]